MTYYLAINHLIELCQNHRSDDLDLDVKMTQKSHVAIHYGLELMKNRNLAQDQLQGHFVKVNKLRFRKQPETESLESVQIFQTGNDDRNFTVSLFILIYR